MGPLVLERGKGKEGGLRSEVEESVQDLQQLHGHEHCAGLSLTRWP